MSQSNKRSIPAWQRSITIPGADEPPTQPKDTPSETTATAAKENENTETADVLEQARRFLEDPTIKNAPKEKKLAFLESKGLRREDVESLFEWSTNTKSSETASVTAATTSTAYSENSKQTSASDVPPIITYPEFLVHANKPPPLVTTSFLLNTAYFASGLAATMWGLSKYIVEPMQAHLAESRHEFLEHASSQLTNLNTKLTSVVSTVPSSRLSTSNKADQAADNASEKSEDSDPTELFHHDIGTQTSPTLLSRRESVASSSSDQSSTDPPAQQEDRLRNISSNLKDLQSSSRRSTETEAQINTQLAELNSYLSDMRYSSQYASASKYTGAWAGLGGGASTDTNDEIDNFMKDIKAVKGVLLSTRSFPRAGPSSYGGA